MANIQEEIFRSIETIVEKKIDDIPFDKTVDGMVVNDTLAELGQYVVKYQDIEFKAFSNNNTVKYKNEDNVMILIPGGDFNAKKSIVGLKDVEGEVFLDVVDILDRIQRIGYNYVAEEEGFEVTFEGGKDDDNYIEIRREDMVKDYPGKTNLLLGATVTSNLEPELGADYGLELEVKFGEELHTYKLSLGSMKGNPYRLNGKYQSFVFGLPTSKKLTEVVGARVYIKGFKEKGFIKFGSLDIQYVKPKDADSLDSYSAELFAPTGTFFKNGKVEKEQSLKLEMRLFKQGESYDPGAEYKWFYSDPLIDSEYQPDGKPTPGYDEAAGLGWHEITSDIPESVLTIEEGGKHLVITPRAVPNFLTFRCIAKFGGEVIAGVKYGEFSVDAAETVVDQTDALNILINSSEGDTFKEYGNIKETTLECKVILGTEVIDPKLFDYVWVKVSDDGKENVIPGNSQDPKFLTVEVMDDIIDIRNYICRVYLKPDDSLF